MYWLIVALAATKLIPAGIGLFHFKEFKPSLKAFTALMILGAINEAILFALAKSAGNNLYMLHFFAMGEVALLSLFYYHEIKSLKVRRALPLVALAVIAFAGVYAMFNGNLFKYPSEPRVVDALLIIVLSLALFYEMATTGDSKDPANNACYFINGGILLYFTATFITWLMMKYVINDQSTVYALYGSHAYINAFCNLVFAYGLWVSSRSLSLS